MKRTKMLAEGNRKETVLGVDIGGSHITVAVVDVSARILIPATLIRRKIDADASAEVILRAWIEALKAAENAYGNKCMRLAVAMPGPFDYGQGISLIKGMNKYEALYGWNIREVFSEEMDLPADEILFLNDAEAFLRGEAFAGAGTGNDRIFGITLGTGLGSAFFEQGNGTDLNLGSSAFIDGIAEDYISTRGIMAYYRALGGEGVANVKALVENIQEDDYAEKAMNQLALWLADFLVLHLPQLKPELVIIGGNISKAHASFLPKVGRILGKQGLFIPIKIAETGEQAAILGAASCF